MTPPLPRRGFRWDDAGSAPVLRCEPMAAVARHAFTSRQLRLRGDDPDAWTRAAAVVACPADALHHVRQVHGATVHVVDQPGRTTPIPAADALVTATPDIALAVVSADCVPVLLADPESGAVGAVHAGWRGTAADVAGAAVRALSRQYGVEPSRIVAAIGPSIGACCYDVGEELRPAFATAGHPARDLDAWFSRDPDGRSRLDLWLANQDLLVRAGLARDNVHVAGLCTKTHLGWFESYRADGPKAGRLAAIIVAPDARSADSR
jgi:polyphenol oxidase